MNLAELTREIIEGKGYIILPDLLSLKQANKARELILKFAQQDREDGKLVIQGAKERLYGLIYKDKIFAKLVQDKLILAITEAILGEDLILGGFSAHILHPGSTRMGIHVDYPYWAMSSPFPKYPILEIQVIWMLDDFTANNGAPLFASGTQNLATTPDLAKFEQNAEKITGTAGSAIISHGLCWHDTSVNNSDRSRISLLGNYTPQYIHPLENNLFDFNSAAIENSTPQLKKLLRHTWMSKNNQIYGMKFKNN
ncbi:phytanoyl-CoA dioxygenase family protein [Waterburya agarophytonicola K14]|uniref:Phytanoyl-CoA dioxygenase family protein n=1 Tax=Waterburya agarophytonicola KI4 TaxID=2874699 RepID=A0A964FGQ9_9CYAN|nr:phytanoyl-CoA dioxygenase family protein [Waterburya agarophytonicola KI4]